MRHLIWLIFVFTQTVSAQTFPENGILYSHDYIPKIYITISPDSLEELYLEENWYFNYYYTAQFVFDSQGITDTIENIGFRFRGNTARDKIKKSFKISFNQYESGRRYRGVKKLNLNAETNDPSMIRSRTCWDLFRKLDVAGSRSNHVEVYVNGDYFGLYQNIEHIDNDFVEAYFGNNKGNLFKCTYPANLDYISSNSNDYKFTAHGNRIYELKTNEELDDYSNLAAFIGFLNNSNDEDFRCRFSEYFNVYNYLKIAAIDVLIGNWDGYLYNNNNFYLYENPLTNRIEYIPYDLDNTWGIDWMGPNWATRNIYNYHRWDQPRPLFTRLMAEPEYRDIFTWYIRNILENTYNTAEHRQNIENIHDFITASALSDPYRPLDFFFDEDDFLNALTQTAASHVKQSVLGFGDLREQKANEQLENTTIAPIVLDVKTDFSNLPEALSVTVYTDGPATNTAELVYSFNGIDQANISVTPIENTLSFLIAVPDEPVEFTYNIQLTGENALSRTAFCESKTIFLNQPEPQVVINELVSSNQTVIADEHGEYDDWIELYNAGDVAVNLSKYYFSDKPAAPLLWQLPDVTINPGSHLLFWADGQVGQGAMHTNFSIKAAGEQIYLFKMHNDELTLVDHVDMPAIPTDYSYGRETDGADDWIVFAIPTPNAQNQIVDGLDYVEKDALSVYPNPTQGAIYFTEYSKYRLSDLSGRKLKEGQGETMSLNELAAGIYLVELNGKVFKISKL